MEKMDSWGQTADAYLVSTWHANEAALQHMIEVAKPSGGTVLDLGTGVGHAAFAFAPYVDKVVGVDTSAGMLRLAAAEAERRRLDNVEFRQGDALSLPFEAMSFEGVVCRVAAHHFVEPTRFLEEAFRVLKPGGYLLLIDTVGSDDPDADERIHELESLRDASHVRDYPVKSWRKMAKKAGFDSVYEDTISKPLNAAEWMDRKKVGDEDRPKIIEMITGSKGWFREYLRPHGQDETLTFHLVEMTLLLTKPR